MCLNERGIEKERKKERKKDNLALQLSIGIEAEGTCIYHNSHLQWLQRTVELGLKHRNKEIIKGGRGREGGGRR